MHASGHVGIEHIAPAIKHSLAVGALVLGAALAGVAITSAIMRARKSAQTDALSFKTRFGTARIFEVEGDGGRPVRLLEVDGTVQSGTYVDDGPELSDDARYAELVFEYLKKYDLMFQHNPHIERVCVLGCGGYDYPEHLIAHHPQVTVDAVEIDPAITALAKRYFYLDRLIEEFDAERTKRLNLVESDALEFLKQGGPHYDAIVNDVFDGNTPPAHLTTHAFYAAARNRLKPDGVFLTNIVSALAGPHARFLHDQVALMELVFSKVEVHPCNPDDLQSEDNVVVIAYA